MLTHNNDNLPSRMQGCFAYGKPLNLTWEIADRGTRKQLNGNVFLYFGRDNDLESFKQIPPGSIAIPQRNWRTNLQSHCG